MILNGLIINFSAASEKILSSLLFFLRYDKLFYMHEADMNESANKFMFYSPNWSSDKTIKKNSAFKGGESEGDEKDIRYFFSMMMNHGALISGKFKTMSCVIRMSEGHGMLRFRNV